MGRRWEAAYTPLSIDAFGRIFSQNDLHLFVVGEGGGDVHDNDESNGPETPARHPEPDQPDQD